VTATVLSRRERRKAETRRRLMEAAAGVYAQVGVEGATIGAITQAADVGLGTFYLHFDDKDDIASAVAGDLLTRIGLAAREAAAHADPDDALGMHRAATRAVCHVAADEARLLHALYRWHGRAGGSRLRETFVANLALALDRAMASGRLRRQDPVLAAHAVLGLYAESILFWASSGNDDWDALAEFLERASVGALS